MSSMEADIEFVGCLGYHTDRPPMCVDLYSAVLSSMEADIQFVGCLVYHTDRPPMCVDVYSAVMSSVEADIQFVGCLWPAATDAARRCWFLHHLHVLSHLHENRTQL